MNIDSTNNSTDIQRSPLPTNDHIRKYLLKKGLINHRGEIIPKKEYDRARKHRSQQRGRSGGPVLYTGDKRKRPRPISVRRPFHSNTRQKSASNSKHIRPLVSKDIVSRKREIKSASVTRHEPINKRQSPIRRSRRSRSPSIRRADILKRPILIIEPCKVTMIYYGPQTMIDYDSSWFEHEGDEILVMQQHCGGENLIVYKGFLKHNETFTFNSRRHRDFPFALAFYVKGLIDSRLSACCECKHRHGVRLGGRRGLFGIKNVKNSIPCRRCRYEQRMKKLTPPKPKSPVVIDRSRYQTSVVPRAGLVMRTPSPQERERSATTTRSRSSTVSCQKPQATSSPKKEEIDEPYASDFDGSNNATRSLTSTPCGPEVKLDTPKSTTKNDDNPRSPSAVSSIKTSDDEEITSISEDGNDDFKKMPRPKLSVSDEDN